ncbi:MAG: CUAEP/CCAEP-tail radical SAM protein [Acidimicrobiia bacterium]
MRVLLVSTYELGHQPVNLARPAAQLRERGHEVRQLDTSIDPWQVEWAEWADRIAFSVPMHTAARLARELATTVGAPTCCYGLYAHLCADVADRTIGGEYDVELVEWVEGGVTGSTIDLGRPTASATPLPDRASLPPLERYTHLVDGTELRVVGSVETTRGCAHTCRHCPVPVVYGGRVRVQDERSVLADVDQLVVGGATHLTFGDPDFLNAPEHARRIVRAMHAAHPTVTFDCTVKVEHVLRHRDLWPELAAQGCVFVVSAFESVDDATLERLDKGHTTAEAAEAVELLRAHGIDVRPSFLPFTPWTTREQLTDLLDFVHAHDLVGSVDPVQYTIRLLLPEGSLLLDHPEMAEHLGGWDADRLGYSWAPADPEMDELQLTLAALVEASLARDDAITETYRLVRAAAGALPVDLTGVTTDRPRLSESWFCCAEPTTAQLGAVSAS